MNITGISNASSTQIVQETNNQTLGKDEFLQLLVTQLKYQDPLNPMENQEFIAQSAQFSALEQMQNMNKTLEEGLGQLKQTQEDLLISFNSWQSMASGLDLVGKEISGFTSDGETITGLVEKVKLNNLVPVAIVQGKEIDASNIYEISAVLNTSENDVETAGEETNE